MFFIFIPLQIFAMWTTLSGFIRPMNDENGSTNAERGTRQYFFDLTDGCVGAFLLFLTNMGRTMNYEGKSKQHEMITLQMQWLLDELDLLENDIKMGRRSGTEGKDSNINRSSNININNATIMEEQEERFYQEGKDKRFEKIESNYFTNSQNVQSLLPERIALSYEKLKFTLRLILRPIGVSKDLRRSSCVKADDGKYEVDDQTYYRVINYAYSELAVILGKGFGAFLPPPDRAVKRTIENVIELLCSEDENCLHRKLARTTRGSNNKNSRNYSHSMKSLGIASTSFDDDNEEEIVFRRSSHRTAGDDADNRRHVSIGESNMHSNSSYATATSSCGTLPFGTEIDMNTLTEI